MALGAFSLCLLTKELVLLSCCNVNLHLCLSKLNCKKQCQKRAAEKLGLCIWKTPSELRGACMENTHSSACEVSQRAGGD